MDERDRGSMLIVVIFVGVALTAAVSSALVPVLTDLVDQQRANAAADAAALAGVAGGRGAAADLAQRNGATLVTFSRAGRTVTVRVRVGDRVVAAGATDEP